MNDPRGRQPYLFYCPLIGIGIWLGFPNDFLSFPPAALLWPLGLVAFAEHNDSAGDTFRKGWLASWLGCLAALYWLCLPVSEVGQLPLALALLCAAAISFCIAIQGALFAAFAFSIKYYDPWSRIPLLALAWYLLELFLAVTVGFPWLPLSAAFAQWPIMIQGANLVGAYMLGALWLLCALAVFYGLAGKLAPGFSIIPAGMLAACLLAFGAWRLDFTRASDTSASGSAMYAIMIDGNIDQNQKWIPAFQAASLGKYIRLTDMALAGITPGQKGRALLVWPETALPFFFQRNRPLAEETRQAVRNWGLPLLFGAPGVEIIDGKDAVFNRAFLLGPDGETIASYDKQHLVPFGEYYPDWLKLDFLEALLQGVGVYSPGTASNPLRYGDLALGMLICYESIFPWLAQASVSAGANILLDISNDGWFGQTPAARQHLLLTAMRCVEQDRWLLRSTNTGISAIIDPAGRIVVRGGLFQDGFIRHNAALRTDTSCFHQLNDYLPYTALAFFCLILLVGHGRRTTGKEKT